MQGGDKVVLSGKCSLLVYRVGGVCHLLPPLLSLHTDLECCRIPALSLVLCATKWDNHVLLGRTELFAVLP